MRKYIDYTDKKNEIRLLFKHPLYKDKIIIVVEGTSDIRLFRDIINYSWVKLESIDGKKELVKLMKDLHLEFPEKILGICDADHDRLVENIENRETYSVYITDFHDAEIMVLNSPALESFVSEYGAPDMFEAARSSLMGLALTAANTIGTLRWINTEFNLNLNFKGLNFNEFVRADRLSINVDTNSLIDLLINRSEKLSDATTKEFILEKLHEFMAKDASKLQVCCGHDVSNIISIIFRQRSISLETNIDHKKVESALRLSYHRDYFKSTALFSKIYERLNKENIVYSEAGQGAPLQA